MSTLVILAAGMGSRFGGLKQLQSVSSSGKTLFDYTVYDAVKCGCDKVVFVIRRETESAFRGHVSRYVSNLVRTEFVYQQNPDALYNRKKPWGTAHAVLCCSNEVNEPFVMVNADDYYGRNAFKPVFCHLSGAKRGEYAMSAYRLKNTVSLNGVVSRGVCSVKDGCLTSVTEINEISSECAFIFENAKKQLDKDSLVSMNLWGFTPDIFGLLENDFKTFLSSANLQTDEFQIPAVVARAIANKFASVKVYGTSDKWYGLTYREDLTETQLALTELEDAGYYN